jgi:hypothetical protein
MSPRMSSRSESASMRGLGTRGVGHGRALEAARGDRGGVLREHVGQALLIALVNLGLFALGVFAVGAVLVRALLALLAVGGFGVVVLLVGHAGLRLGPVVLFAEVDVAVGGYQSAARGSV